MATVEKVLQGLCGAVEGGRIRYAMLGRKPHGETDAASVNPWTFDVGLMDLDGGPDDIVAGSDPADLIVEMARRKGVDPAEDADGVGSGVFELLASVVKVLAGPKLRSYRFYCTFSNDHGPLGWSVSLFEAAEAARAAGRRSVRQFTIVGHGLTGGTLEECLRSLLDVLNEGIF